MRTNLDFDLYRFSDNNDEAKPEVGLYAVDEKGKPLDMTPKQISAQYGALAMIADGFADFIRQELSTAQQGWDLDIFVFQDYEESSFHIEPRSDRRGAIPDGFNDALIGVFQIIHRISLEEGFNELAVSPEYCEIETKSLQTLFDLYLKIVEGAGYDISAIPDDRAKPVIGHYTIMQISDALEHDRDRLAEVFERSSRQAAETSQAAAVPLAEDKEAQTRAASALMQTIFLITGSQNYHSTFFQAADGYRLFIAPTVPDRENAMRLKGFFKSLPVKDLPEGVACNKKDWVFRLTGPEQLYALDEMLQAAYGVQEALNELAAAEKREAGAFKLWDRPVRTTAHGMIQDILFGIGRFKYKSEVEWEHSYEGAHIFGVDPQTASAADYEIIQGMMDDMIQDGGSWSDLSVDKENLVFIVKDLGIFCRFLDSFAASRNFIYGTNGLKNAELNDVENFPYDFYESILQKDETIAHVLGDETFVDRKHMLRNAGKLHLLVEREMFVCPYSTDDVHKKILRPQHSELRLNVM